MIEKLGHLRNKIVYFKKDWKQILHIILGTRHFGVNNQWWSPFPSLFGQSLGRIILNILIVRPLVRNYKRAKYRAETIGFLHPSTVRSFGWKYPGKKDDE